MKDGENMAEVDLQNLLLDGSKLEKDFYSYEADPQKIPEFEHNDLINDWLIEHVRRFNETAGYLLRSLQKVSDYGKLLSEGKRVIVQHGISVDFLKEHRVACRDACINIDIYIEVIKSFCRYYFFMDKEATDDGKKWDQAMRQYQNIGGWKSIESFLTQCQKLYQLPDTKFIIKIRNDEVHNESPLELIKYHFEGNVLQPHPDEYVISNETLHNKITNTVGELIATTQALQHVLETISPYSIYQYLQPQDGQLKHIIKMSERYKRERTYFSKHVLINPRQ